MSTRGAYGFRIDGQDKITYNHSNSYPDGLGVNLLQWMAGHSVAELKALARSLTLVPEFLPPTPEEIATCQRWADPAIDPSQPIEWYELLRNVRGNPKAWDDGLPYIIDNAAFLQNSLSCRWGYVINCDDEIFEVYQGANLEPIAQAPRYAVQEPNDYGYYACRLVAVGDLHRLPSAESFIAQLEPTPSVPKTLHP